MSGDPQDNCPRFQELIDAHVDGELEGGAAADLKAHLSGCPDCAGAYRLALRLRSELQALPGLSCPDGVIERVFAQVAAPTPTGMQRFLRVLFANPGRHLRLAAWAAAIVVIVAGTSVFIHRHGTRPGITAEEAARAEAEMKWTLAYIGEIGRRSALLVRDDVIQTRVLKPASDAARSAFGHEDSTPPPRNNGGST